MTCLVKLLVHRFEAKNIEVGLYELDDKYPLAVDMLTDTSYRPGFK
jgi:hypothetical protein